jgi:hypothetical protein
LIVVFSAMSCPDVAGRTVAMQKSTMGKSTADPWDESPAVRTLVVLTIISILMLIAAWSMLIAYGAWVLFHWIAG